MSLHRWAHMVARAALRAPIWTLLLSFTAAVGSLAYTAVELRLEPDRNALIRPGRDWNDRFEAYRRDFAGTKDFLVVVRGGTISERTAFVDALQARLEDDPHVQSTFGRVEPKAFAGSQLVLMDPVELNALRNTLSDHQSALLRLVEEPSLEANLAFVDRAVSRALVQTVVSGLFGSDDSENAGTANEDSKEADEVDLSLLVSLLRGIRDTLKTGQASDLDPWRAWLEEPSSGYISVPAGLLVSVAQQGLADGPFMDRLRSHLEALEAAHPPVRAGITGQRAINVAELRATVQDTRWAGILALLGVAVVFVAGFGRARHPLLAVASLLFGIAFSAGALTAVVGHLTVLSVAFTSILVGLGIDFGIHVVSRYEEAIERGMAREAAVEAAMENSMPGNVAAGVTTSLAFFGVGLSDFLGLAELGIIAGMGVLLCLWAQITVLPALLVLFGGSRRRQSSDALPGWAQLIDRRPRSVAAVGLGLALAGYAVSPVLRFDGNMLRLQATGVEAVDLELELIGHKGSAFAVSRAPDLESARALEMKLAALPEVASVESLTRLLPPDLPRRMEAARELRPQVAPLAEAAKSAELPQAWSHSELLRRIDKLRFKLRPEAEERWDEGQRPQEEALSEARRLLDQVKGLLEGDLPHGPALLTYQTQVAKDMIRLLTELEAETEPVEPSIERIPEEMKARMVGPEGDILLRIHPEENVWEDEARSRFVAALRSVDPKVTGIPIQNHEASRLMVRGYIQGGLISLLLVVGVLAVDLRRPKDMAAALLPLLGGTGWTLGAMAGLGLAFNLANLIICPLMIGIGIDIGLHMVHRRREDGQGGGRLAAGSTGRAVVLSSLTTMVGFGSLAVAQHRGIQSLGILLAVGVASTLGAAFVVLAPLLRRPG